MWLFGKKQKQEDVNVDEDNENALQGHQLAAVKHCKRLLGKVADTQDKDALNLMLRVITQGEGSRGGQRRTSLAKEFDARGTDATVQEYIMKSVVGPAPAVDGATTNSEIAGLPESVAHMMITVNRERSNNRIACCVLAKPLKSALLESIAYSVDPGRKSVRAVTETDSILGQPFTCPPLVNLPELDSALQHASSWEKFDMFYVAKVTENRPLIHICMHLLHKYSLFQELPIEEETMMHFLCAVESCYTETNPYHNRTHAADVVQTMHALLVESGSIRIFSPLQIFASIIGAAVHDLDHPGYSNPFVINLESEVATTYNNRSVLESHHLASFTRVTRHPQCDIFSRFQRHQKVQCKQMIVEIVLGTDMMRHPDMIEEFKSKTESGDLSSTHVQKEYEIGFLRMCLHVADVSNPGKAVHISTEWAHKIMDEFFQQGDLERCMKSGFPLSKECDRRSASTARVQIGFIDFIVRPLLEAWVRVFPTTSGMLQLLADTVAYWKLQQQ